MLFLLILCGAAAFLTTAVLLRFAKGHPQTYGAEMVQRFHAGHVPRVGGLAMLVACTLGWGWMVLAGKLNIPKP